MGNFVNTKYKETINSISNITKDLLKNPYYLFTDKKGAMVVYYNINREKSTLDEAARIPYSDLGPNCPFRFNRITDYFLYGIDRVQLSLENGEAGLESGDIGGEAIVLPGNITPYPGDYFEISHTGETWLFRVNHVDKDTLDDGANIWKLTYKLEHVDNSKILELVSEDFRFITNNMGTGFNTIVQSTKYDVAETLDNICIALKNYYIELFYNKKVQTFIFKDLYEDYFYDPYLIEFLITNNILKGSSDYIYIEHKIPKPGTFFINYNKTFYKSFEDRDIDHLKNAKTSSTADYIDNKISIFGSRPEDYFSINYKIDLIKNILVLLDPEIVTNVIENKLFDTPDKKIYNVFVKHFNKIDFDISDFDAIENLDYEDNIRIFYVVPLMIYCLENYIKTLLT